MAIGKKYQFVHHSVPVPGKKHISEDMRRKGIGRTLFLAAKEWAKQKGAKKLYISAHSAVESQAFYKSMGCVEAEVYNKKHVEDEPYDCQLECDL